MHCGPPSFRERGRDTPPFVLSCGERRDIVVTADLRGAPSLDVEETGEGATRRLITNSIHLLLGHASTAFQCGVHGPRAIDKRLKLRILETLWALARLPSYVSLCVNQNPSLISPSRPRGTPLAYGIDRPSMAAMTSGSIGTSSNNTSPFGEHSEARKSDLTVVQIFYGVKSLKRLNAKRSLWNGQP